MALQRATVRRLRNGVVPSWELDRFSVGYAKAREGVSACINHLRQGRPQTLFVTGEWGSGKSHFLAFVRASAEAFAVPSAVVSLNARGMPLNYPQRFYSPLVESIRVPGCAPGLRNLLNELLRDAGARAKLEAFAREANAGEIGWAVGVLCEQYERDERCWLDDQPAWSVLLGGDLGWADYTYKRIRAIEQIGNLGRLFATVGLGGLVITFDEAETIEQLWNSRSRMSAYSVLGRLCRLDRVWCVMGITDRFGQTIEDSLMRGASSYAFTTDDAEWFLQAWQRSAFRILATPEVDLRAARSLATAVSRTYEEAFCNEVNRDTVDRCLEDWASNPSRNPRRLIRLLVHRLDVERRL